jgi:hypothetical protein
LDERVNFNFGSGKGAQLYGGPAATANYNHGNAGIAKTIYLIAACACYTIISGCLYCENFGGQALAATVNIATANQCISGFSQAAARTSNDRSSPPFLSAWRAARSFCA